MRLSGEWSEWVRFFLEGVRETSQQAFQTARRIINITEEDRRSIESAGRRRGSTLQIHEAFRKRPIMSAGDVVKSTQLTTPTVNSCVETPTDMGLIKEITGRRSQWRDTKTRRLEDYLNDIIAAMIMDAAYQIEWQAAVEQRKKEHENAEARRRPPVERNRAKTLLKRTFRLDGRRSTSRDRTP
ncbi:MAG: hypothetical protein R6V29_10465 [Spirochaetia bacterium]